MSQLQNGSDDDAQMENEYQKQQALPKFDGSSQMRLVPKNITSDLFADSHLMHLKLPSSVRMQATKYDAATYRIEDPIEYVNENQGEKKKQTNICPVDNIVRWREAKGGSSGDPYMDDDQQYLNDIDPNSIKSGQADQIESNSRIIEWSDGTMSLAIGNELFDILKEDIINSDLFIKYDNDLAILKGQINNKIVVKPTARTHMHTQMFKTEIMEKERTSMKRC